MSRLRRSSADASAGLVKVLLQLRHSTLAPTPGSGAPMLVKVEPSPYFFVRSGAIEVVDPLKTLALIRVSGSGCGHMRAGDRVSTLR